MCTPSVAIDIILYSLRAPSSPEYDVWLVRRVDTSQLATIGGFVEMGETTEDAVLREVEEETGLLLDPNPEGGESMKLLGVYSDPRRDNRRHIISVAYALEFVPGKTKTKDGGDIPKAGSDAKEVVRVPLEHIGKKYKGDDLYADHMSILLDFKERFPGRDRAVIRKGEIYDDIKRSTCASFT